MNIEDYMLSRTFIEVPLFTKRWKEIGLTDEEDNLTQKEKQILKKLVKTLKEEAGKNRRGKS